MGIFGWDTSARWISATERNGIPQSTTPPPHPESQPIRTNMFSSLLQWVWQLVLAWTGQGTPPSLRLAESTKIEELKIKNNEDGTPCIYKLPMKEEFMLPEKKIARQSIGEPGQFQEKVLLVVGATGAGKSTLINGMANYIMGVQWKDDFRFKLVIDDPSFSTSKSQTKYITAYTFYPTDGSALPYKFTIIDTPGFGDTEGIKRDKDITKQIKDFFSIAPPNGIDHLDGIGIVTQASLARFTPTQEYVFASVLSIFGKDLSKNIFLMVTYADGQKPPVLKAIKDTKITNYNKFYKFNNSALFADSKGDEENFDAIFWKMGFRSFKDFFTELSLAESVSVDLTKEVFKERDHLQSLLESLAQQVTTSPKRIEDLQKDENMRKARKCLGRLNEIALKSDPLLNLDHLELYIDSEKQQAEPGWEKRVQYLEEAKLQAKILCNKKRRLAEIAKREELKIKDGTPSIYRLDMKEELTDTRSMIAKQSIGKPGHFKEKVLLVVGATGAGKSTLINGMVNYIMGVKWEDGFRFKVVIDDAKVCASKSQTKYITAYTFNPMEGSALSYKLTIIDTPGFGDTEGLKRDRDITKQIKAFFSIVPPNGIDHLDGIGFVTQASLSRLTPTQEYIFSSVLSIFGKNLSKNIFMMVTFADGQKPPVLKAIKDANITSNDKFFKFNNSALFADNKENEDEEGFDAMFWKMGFRSFTAFFDDFPKAESVKLDLTKEVLKERDQLQTLIEGLNPQITMGLNKIEEMRQEENVLKQREKEIETNKEFTYTVEISKPRKIDISGKGIFTTTCLKCSYTCHQECAFSDDDDKNRCSAMDSVSGYCTVCTGHCYWDEHKNLPFLWVYEPVVETRTSENLKRKYENAKKGKFKVKNMIDKLDEHLQNVHTNVMVMIHQAQGCLRRLDEIALKPNPLSNVEYLELLIESEKQGAKPGWMQRIKYLDEAKLQAEVLSKVKDVNTAKTEIEKSARSGEKWYKRFKFW